MQISVPLDAAETALLSETNATAAVEALHLIVVEEQQGRDVQDSLQKCKPQLHV
jgi:hypothetical protein